MSHVDAPDHAAADCPVSLTVETATQNTSRRRARSEQARGDRDRWPASYAVARRGYRSIEICPSAPRNAARRAVRGRICQGWRRNTINNSNSDGVRSTRRPAGLMRSRAVSSSVHSRTVGLLDWLDCVCAANHDLALRDGALDCSRSSPPPKRISIPHQPLRPRLPPPFGQRIDSRNDSRHSALLVNSLRYVSAIII
jgi:hypothetical protein